MSLPNAANIKRLAGRLCKDPTDLSLPFPHGGIALGTIRDGQFQIRQRRFGLVAEEFSCEVEYFTTMRTPTLAVVVRETDSDWLRSTFLSVKDGSQTGRPLVLGDVKSDDARAGTKAPECAIYVSPLSDLEPAVYLPHAQAAVDEAAQINLTFGTEVGILCLFLAVPGNNKLSYQVGTARDIEL